MPAKKNEDGELLKQMKDLIFSQQEVLSSLVKEMQGNKRQQNQFSANAPRQNFYGAMRRLCKTATQLQEETSERQMDNPSVPNANGLDILLDYVLIKPQ